MKRIIIPCDKFYDREAQRRAFNALGMGGIRTDFLKELIAKLFETKI